MEYPPCFGSSNNFEAWVRQSEKDGLEDPRLSFCLYCSTAFQKLMDKQGKCINPTLDLAEVAIKDDFQEHQLELF